MKRKDLGKRKTFNVMVAAQKDGYSLGQYTLTWNIQPVVQWLTYALIGLIMAAVAITGAVVLMRRK